LNDQQAEDAMSILRLLIAVVLVVVVGAVVMGYLSNRSGRAATLPSRAETSDTVARAREGAAQIGEKAGEAASTVGATLEEAALTTKIKAKMALDDMVKARSIDVTTRGTTVTLSGIVGSKAEHDRAMALARETDGVTDVVDNMRMLQRVD
jgi:hyperosmotically inducible periplasmic protein